MKSIQASIDVKQKTTSLRHIANTVWTQEEFNNYVNLIIATHDSQYKLHKIS
jgi:hypothetical protein